MNDPELDLLNLIKNNWNDGRAGVNKADIMFHRSLSRVAESGLHEPQIIFDHRSAEQEMRQDQTEVVEQLLAYIFIWVKDSSDAELESTKAKKWKMIDEVHAILKTATLPSGWDWTYVSALTNLDNWIVPPILAEELVVKVHYQRV